MERKMAQVDGNVKDCSKLYSVEKSHQWPIYFDMDLYGGFIINTTGCCMGR